MSIRSGLLFVLSLATLAQGDRKCEQLAKGHLKGTRSGFVVNIAQSKKDGSSFQGDTEVSEYNTAMKDLPAHCRVAAQFNTSSKSTVNFEIWLPSEKDWHQRFLALGNGGWNGAVNYPEIGKGLRKGFASMSTNTGHNSSSDDGDFFKNDEEGIDFGHRAMHLSTEYSKRIIEAYYSKPASWSYYMGCSTGGRQGMAEIQLYPEDFDGALVGDPVIWQTHEEAWEAYVGKGQYPTTLDSYIRTDQWSAVHDEVIRQCDDLDGVKDGIISDPERCSFVPERLLCGLGVANASTCLTPPQLANLEIKYRGWVDEKNTLVWPGMPPGSENTGIQGYTNAEVAGGYALSYYQNAILNDSSWHSTDIDYADVKIAEKVNSYGGIADAFSPDLTAFQAHGGKLLHYHGWQDSVVNSGISTMYYRNVLSHYAGLGKKKVQSVSDFYRLFMIPGMGHCTGGDGAWAVGTESQEMPPAKNDTEHSALLALVKWRESQQAPEHLIGTKYVNETVVGETPVDLTIKFTRPICRWPVVPQFKGGHVANADDWECPSTEWF